MTLATFESAVFAQTPASVPWQPVTPFDFESRKAVEGKHPELIRNTFALGPTDLVIDAGCGPEGILVRLLSDLGLNVIGFDPQISPRSINPRLVYGSLLETTQDGRDAFADLVICREVLEHLTVLQIHQAVGHLCALSKQFVYVTTRFAHAPASLLDFETSDDLDPTHITMLNQDFLRVLFVLEGFKRRADLEQQLDWQQKGRVLVYERAA